jgi:hypothetical protein
MTLLASVFFAACSDGEYGNGSYSYDEPSIYSDSDDILLSEILLFISPYLEYEGQKQYIVMDTLSNLSLTVNNMVWDLTDSYSLDTLHLHNKKTIGTYRTTGDAIVYPVVVNVRKQPDNLTTAGQYADLLLNYVSLWPGSYVCQIKSFDIKTALGKPEKVYTPNLAMPIEVKENITSSNLGLFEVRIN